MSVSGVFVTATDTGVGKTVVSCGLAFSLKARGMRVGYMKPVQCGGDDALFITKALGLKDEPKFINPYFSPYPLAPQAAFGKEGKVIKREGLLEAYRVLKSRYDFVVVEGAGGLLVPLAKDYCLADLIRDMGLPSLVVSRLSLGTINHTLLTIHHLRSCGIPIQGLIFNQAKRTGTDLAGQSSQELIRELAGVPIMGRVAYIRRVRSQQGLKQLARCFLKNIDLEPLFNKKDVSRPEKLVQWDKGHIWHPFTQMKEWLEAEPLVIEEAKGNYLKDTRGRWYLDGVSSLWVNVHGHRHPLIDKRILQQLSKMAHSTLLGLGNAPSIELARELIRIVPQGLKKVFFSDDGSTSVEVALKMAYQYWQHRGKKTKQGFVCLREAYHGDTLGAVSVGGIELFHTIFAPLLFKSWRVANPYCYRCPKGLFYPACELACLQELEAVLEKDHGRLAALIVEPLVQAAAGMLVWPAGVLAKMRELTHKYQVLLIVDEVATGFGRTGKMFACEHEKISPDIMCLSKGLSAGYLPIACTLTTQDIYDAFVGPYPEKKTFFHGHSYTGNPLACAASLGSLEVFRKERVLEKLSAKILHLQKGLRQLSGLASVGDIRQLGFMVGIELVKDKASKAPYAWEERMGIRVCEEIRKKGIILRPLGNVIVLMPPLSIEKKEIDVLLEAAYEAIREVTS